MTRLLTNLSNTINKNFIIPLVSGELEIIESDAECKKVILKSKRNQIFAFSLDKNPSGNCKIFPFFNQTTPLINKVNDGIVLYKNNNFIQEDKLLAQ